MTRKRKALLALAAIAVSATIFGLYTASSAGAFRDIEPRTPGPCHKVEGIVGGEDLEWRPSGREVIVAAQDRRDPDTQGHLYLLDPRDKEAEPVEITPDLDFPFHPHGMDLFVGEDGAQTLFVVNHRGGLLGPHSVEVFDIGEQGKLAHTRSIEGEGLVSPNDLVAVSPESFYVTNDHGSSSHLMHMIEDTLYLSRANLGFFDGESFREVYSGARYANGVSLSDDGKELYLAETTRKTIKTFARDPETNDIRLEQTVQTNTGVDNIDVAPDGSLWVGAHPNMLAFLGHAADAESRSPSEVIHLTRNESGMWGWKSVYVDRGDPLSGSAAAAVHAGVLVVGPVFDPWLLVCEVGEIT